MVLLLLLPVVAIGVAVVAIGVVVAAASSATQKNNDLEILERTGSCVCV